MTEWRMINEWGIKLFFIFQGFFKQHYYQHQPVLAVNKEDCFHKYDCEPFESGCSQYSQYIFEVMMTWHNHLWRICLSWFLPSRQCTNQAERICENIWRRYEAVCCLPGGGAGGAGGAGGQHWGLPPPLSPCREPSVWDRWSKVSQFWLSTSSPWYLDDQNYQNVCRLLQSSCLRGEDVQLRHVGKCGVPEPCPLFCPHTGEPEFCGDNLRTYPRCREPPPPLQYWDIFIFQYVPCPGRDLPWWGT